jgi:hypothetical protein
MLADMKRRYPQHELARRFSDAMQEADLGLTDVAKACGVTPQAIYDWRLTGRIGKQHLVTIARITKKPLEYFLVGLGRAALLCLALLFAFPQAADAGQKYSLLVALCIMSNWLKRLRHPFCPILNISPT